MFETRLHTIQSSDSIDKRKLWEGWLQWANKLSAIDSDAIARGEFFRNRFTIDTFLELFHDGQDVSEDNGSVSNESGTLVAVSKKIVSLAKQIGTISLAITQAQGTPLQCGSLATVLLKK